MRLNIVGLGTFQHTIDILNSPFRARISSWSCGVQVIPVFPTPRFSVFFIILRRLPLTSLLSSVQRAELAEPLDAVLASEDGVNS